MYCDPKLLFQNPSDDHGDQQMYEILLIYQEGYPLTRLLNIFIPFFNPISK